MAAGKKVNETTTKRCTASKKDNQKADSKTTKAKTTAAKATTKKKSTSTTLGRPKKVDPRELAKNAYFYAENCMLPIVAEFAHQNGITRQYLYELADNEKAKGFDDLSDAIKMISETKEIVLEKGALVGEFQANMAIFSLKQLGWRDKQEQEVNISADDENTSGVILLAPVMEREHGE